MTIRAILQGKGGEVIQIAREASVQEAVALLVERRIGCVPVVEGGTVVGIFSERDVVRCLGSKGADALTQPVGNVMTSPAISVTPDMEVMTALSLMTQRRIRHLPVLDSDRLTGFISIGDLVKYRIDKIEAEAAAMRDYIQSA